MSVFTLLRPLCVTYLNPVFACFQPRVLLMLIQNVTVEQLHAGVQMEICRCSESIES